MFLTHRQQLYNYSDANVMPIAKLKDIKSRDTQCFAQMSFSFVKKIFVSNNNKRRQSQNWHDEICYIKATTITANKT